jgi:hypothetical protein
MQISPAASASIHQLTPHTQCIGAASSCLFKPLHTYRTILTPISMCCPACLLLLLTDVPSAAPRSKQAADHRRPGDTGHCWCSPAGFSSAQHPPQQHPHLPTRNNGNMTQCGGVSVVLRDISLQVEKKNKARSVHARRLPPILVMGYGY